MNREQLKEYFRKDLGWSWGRQAQTVFNFICRAADCALGGVVLDAGCGHQRYKPFFEGSLYIGQEHPEAGVKNKHITTYEILSDLVRIPLADSCVDLVLSTVSVEHLRYPEAFFREAFRILRPGGSLWVQVPFVYMEHEAPFDFQRPTRYGLRRWYEDAGFERIDVVPDISSTDNAIYWVQYAIEEDSRRLKKCLRARVLSRILRKVTEWYCRLLSRAFDRGPFPDTTFPQSWLATAYKAGAPPPREERVNTVSAFLERYGSRGPDVKFESGRLVCLQNSLQGGQ